jgi:hypothetical protein
MGSDFRPAKFDIKMWRNDTWVEVFALTQNSTPISLVGATIYIHIVKGCEGTATLTLTNGSGITITGAGNNQISVSKLINIDKGNYKWDLQVSYSGGVVKTYLEGDFIVYDDVTKP